MDMVVVTIILIVAITITVKVIVEAIVAIKYLMPTFNEQCDKYIL